MSLPTRRGPTSDPPTPPLTWGSTLSSAGSLGSLTSSDLAWTPVHRPVDNACWLHLRQNRFERNDARNGQWCRGCGTFATDPFNPQFSHTAISEPDPDTVTEAFEWLLPGSPQRQHSSARRATPSPSESEWEEELLQQWGPALAHPHWQQLEQALQALEQEQQQQQQQELAQEQEQEVDQQDEHQTAANCTTISHAAAPNDLVKAVDHLLNEVGPKFSRVTTEIFAKLDDMETRLNEMEAVIKADHNSSSSEKSG